MLNPKEIEQRLADQDWRCAYPCAGKGQGGYILPDTLLALAYDNNGLIHLDCAVVGRAPSTSTRKPTG